MTTILRILLFSSSIEKIITPPTTISRKEYTVPPCLFRISLLQPAAIVLTIFSSWVITCQAYAEKASTEEWNVSADKIVRYENPNSIVAKGNVVLIKREKMAQPQSAADIQSSLWSELLTENAEKIPLMAGDVQSPSPQYQTTMTIKADWIVYDVDLKSINAKGNVHITTKDDLLTAKAGTLNLVDETGTFTDATILHKNNTLHLEGKKIEKTGLDTYRIIDGWAITCKLESGQTPPWSFASSETNVRQDGFAVLKNARFNIRNVPVFYSPYLLVPVKSTRQTGFVFPEFSSSTNNGYGVNLPFFLNISESADATFYPHYMSNRGLMPGVEFRYVASETDKGIFTGDFLHDRLSDPSETSYYDSTGYTHDNSDRYWLRGKADQSFAEWQTRLDIDIVSDQDYLSEFDSGLTGFENTHNRYMGTFGRGFQNKTDTLRENTFKTLRSWNGTALQVNLMAINDADTTASDTDTPLWSLPSIDYAGIVPLGNTRFSFDWETSYVDYWREDGVGGHVFDLNPSISTPLSLSPYLESRAELGLHDTFYLAQTYGDAEWAYNDTQNRLYPEFEIEVATTLERNFTFGAKSGRTVTHQMRPYVKYGYIPLVDEGDLTEFEAVDAFDNKNAITYGLDNYINTFMGNEETWNPINDYAELNIAQSYDLRSESSDQPFSAILSEIKWKPLTRTSISYKNYYDVYDNTFTRQILESAYSNSRGDSLSLDYSYSEISDIEQINATVQAYIINGWYAGGKIEHSISQEETVEARGSLTYRAPCWAVRFETRYTPTDTAYLVVFSLANIGSPLGINF